MVPRSAAMAVTATPLMYNEPVLAQLRCQESTYTQALPENRTGCQVMRNELLLTKEASG